MPRSTIVFLLFIAMLSACVPNVVEVLPQTPPTTDSITDPSITTITFASYDRERSYFEPLMDRFNGENPDIQVIFVDLEDVVDGQEAMNDWVGTTVRVADTAFISVSSEDVEKGYVLDLKPLIDADAAFDLDDYYPRAFEPLSPEGRVYVLPTIAEAPMMTFNQTLVAQAGMTVPTEPTWNTAPPTGMLTTTLDLRPSLATIRRCLIKRCFQRVVQ